MPSIHPFAAAKCRAVIFSIIAALGSVPLESRSLKASILSDLAAIWSGAAPGALGSYAAGVSSKGSYFNRV